MIERWPYDPIFPSGTTQNSASRVYLKESTGFSTSHAFTEISTDSV